MAPITRASRRRCTDSTRTSTRQARRASCMPALPASATNQTTFIHWAAATHHRMSRHRHGLHQGFPRINCKSVILTVVDRFSKEAHFLLLGHSYMTTTVMRTFFDNVVKLHDMSSSIVSVCNPVFTEHFWRELFSLVDVKLQMSSTFHP
jgi:uncharacterized protein with WD repeat